MPKKRLQSLGYTIVELLIGIFLLTAVFSGALLVTVYFMRTYNFSFEENQSLTQAQQALRRMSLELREARDSEDGSYPLATANDQEVVFYSDVDNDNQTERVRYYLVGLDLVRQVFNAVGSTATYLCIDQCTICHNPGPNEETIAIPETSWPAHRAHGDYSSACEPDGGGGGGNTGTEADTESVVAEYIRNTTTPLFSYYNGDWPEDQTNNPLPAGSRLLGTRMVKITLEVNTNPNYQPSNFTLSSFTHLRNLKDNL
ncbi:hypothetical protein A3A66_03645 [Microgenomates group bacterium RIFCSPLOWO2_01_FULL_46_13]|nr:MAG: hypothetical protein A2783_03725 [Microgenomates group bacterium RIFCSPHIGHO2_01_FULL_45_11]OGV95161.1 MAG: hypothetical protein A3A66_03645 [Microgenomates group bacterium RIFCSPLOWO2_01_FULL_46_13]